MNIRLNPSQAAITIGLALILMAIAAGIAFGVIHPQIMISGDAEATASAFSKNQPLYLLEVALWLLILLLDVIVSWAMLQYFKSVNIKWARITFWTRIIYSAILALAISKLVQLGLLGSHFQSEAIYRNLLCFEDIWTLGLILFGGHLLSLAWLCRKDSRIKAIWFWLLVIAGLAYTLINGIKAFDGPEDLVTLLNLILALPMTVAELGFGLMLWIKAPKA